MATDARCAENLAGLSEVKGLKSSSRVAGRGQRGVLEMSTVTETMVRREGTRIALYLGPDRSDLLFATKELARDMQILSMLSTLKLRRFAWYLISAADVSPFFAYSDEPGTMLVWTDADWSGNELTCKSTSAGAVQLEYYGIEAWSVLQQVVSFSSDENESYATEMSKADRWETLDHRWNQIRWSGAYPETRAEDVAEQTIQAVEKVPNTIDSINNEAKCTRRTKEKLLGARKALEAVDSESRSCGVAEFAFHSRVRENLPTRCRRDRTRLRMRRSARAILTRSPGKRGDAKTCEQVWNCRCDQSICYTLEHTNTVELLWLHLRTGTNSQCE